MSRGNNTELINPAVRFFDWSGEHGKLRYFDKSIGEKGENVEVPLPFRFLVLDRGAQITGGIDRGSGYEGFWSNFIKDLAVQPFTVRSKAGIEARGLYNQIKGTPGVKFMTGLYIAFHDDDGKLAIGYLKIKGSALTAWIEFTKRHRDIYSGAFAVSGSSKCKKGTNVYYEPVFEHSDNVPEAANELALGLDAELQEYLTAYFAQKGIEEVELQYSGAPQVQAAAASPLFSGAPALGSREDAQAPSGFNPSADQEEGESDVPW